MSLYNLCSVLGFGSRKGDYRYLYEYIHPWETSVRFSYCYYDPAILTMMIWRDTKATFYSGSDPV